MRRKILENKLGTIESYIFEGMKAYRSIPANPKEGGGVREEIRELETAKRLLWNDSESVEGTYHWFRNGYEKPGCVYGWIDLGDKQFMTVGQIKDDICKDPEWTERQIP